MNTDELNVPIYELKIESGVGGGSISLVKNKTRIDEWIGHSIAERNDNLIESLSKLLNRNNLRISEVSKIIYSDHPGSQTGLRIIASIIKGLCAPHKIETVGKNLFEAIAEYHSAVQDYETVIVLPVKTNVFELAKYTGKEKTEENRFVNFEELTSELKKLNNFNYAVLIPFKMLGGEELNIIDNMKSFSSIKIIDTGENLSTYL